MIYLEQPQKTYIKRDTQKHYRYWYILDINLLLVILFTFYRLSFYFVNGFLCCTKTF